MSHKIRKYVLDLMKITKSKQFQNQGTIKKSYLKLNMVNKYKYLIWKGLIFVESLDCHQAISFYQSNSSENEFHIACNIVLLYCSMSTHSYFTCLEKISFLYEDVMRVGLSSYIFPPVFIRSLSIYSISTHFT